MSCHSSHWTNVTLIKGDEDDPHLLSQPAATDGLKQCTGVSQPSEACLLSHHRSPGSHPAEGHSRACAQDPEMWVAVVLVSRVAPTLWPSRGDGSAVCRMFAHGKPAPAASACSIPLPWATPRPGPPPAPLLDTGSTRRGVCAPDQPPVCDPAHHVGLRFKMAAGVWPQEVRPR